MYNSYQLFASEDTLKTSQLSVENCVTRVLLNNPDIEAAKQRIEQARSRFAQAQSTKKITMDTDLGYLMGDTPSAYLFKHIDARKLAPTTDFNNPGRFSALEWGLTAKYNVLDGGKKKHLTGQAQNSLLSQEEEHKIVINNLVGAVIQTYFSILAAKEYVIVVKKSLTTIESQLKEVEIRSETGGALQSDVLTIQVRLARGEESLISAENGVAIAKSALRQLLDLDPTTAITLSGQEWTPAKIPATLEECLTEAMTYRPEIKAINMQILAQKEAIGLAKSGKEPDLNLFGRYSLTDDGAHLEMNRDNWTIGAQVNFNIFDGGKKEGTINEAKSGLTELQARLRASKRQIEVETHKAWLTLGEARTREKVATINSERAEESLTIVREQYESGLVTVTRYLQSEDDRTNSLFRSIKSIYDIKKAKAALGNAIGYCVKYAR